MRPLYFKNDISSHLDTLQNHDSANNLILVDNAKAIEMKTKRAEEPVK